MFKNFKFWVTFSNFIFIDELSHSNPSDLWDFQAASKQGGVKRASPCKEHHVIFIVLTIVC